MNSPEPLAQRLKTAAALLQNAANAPLVIQTDRAIDAICTGLFAGLPLLVCGNGGSASDAMHIAGELVGRYTRERRALNCICLSTDAVVLTALANDYGFETVFSRQVEAHGCVGGILLGLSTSGNSENVVRAFEAARTVGMTTIGMTGEGGGKLAAVSDILIEVPSKSTPEIQQIHICIYHYICEAVEARILL